jgi:hypothetical protein
MPFVLDNALDIAWECGDSGRMRAVITRRGRRMPNTLRTPEAAEEWSAWAETMRLIEQQKTAGEVR